MANMYILKNDLIFHINSTLIQQNTLLQKASMYQLISICLQNNEFEIEEFRIYDPLSLVSYLFVALS